MRIIFIGSLHHDPSGRERLRRTILNLRNDYNAVPAFIAFEWAKVTYSALVPKRGELAHHLRKRFPKLGRVFIDRFANSLAYEGDLHQEIGSTVRSVWMLNNSEKGDSRISGESLIKAAISVKIGDFENWLLPKISNWESLLDEEMCRETTLVYMKESERLAGLCDPVAMHEEIRPSIESGRESHMFSSLQGPLDEADGGTRLGIIIIGSAHLLDVPGSLFNLCLTRGLAVERRWPHEQ
jgi:hypothetical protein